MQIPFRKALYLPYESRSYGTKLAYSVQSSSFLSCFLREKRRKRAKKPPKRSKASPEGSFFSLGRNKKFTTLNDGVFSAGNQKFPRQKIFHSQAKRERLFGQEKTSLQPVTHNEDPPYLFTPKLCILPLLGIKKRSLSAGKVVAPQEPLCTSPERLPLSPLE